ncbi:MAG: peptidoglycan DD-metalloendopeptidase family protein, partial [Patescibacteria group bacterium]
MKYRLQLATMFLALLMAPNFVWADELDDLRREREGLQNNIAELEAKITEYQKNLNSKRGEVASLKGEIDRINAQVGKLNLEIKRTENQIYVTRLNIKETQTDIEKTELSIVEKKEILASLLRELYRFDEESILERALKYNTLTEVVKETERLGSVQNKMNDTLDDTKILKNRLENKEEDLKENKKELENKNSQLTVQKSAQQSEKTRKDTVLKTTKGEEQKYQQLLTQTERDHTELLKNLARIEEQISIEKNFANYFKAGTIPKKGTKIFAWPEDGADVTHNYGVTALAKRGIYGGKGHNGIDIKSGLAAPVKAAAGGKIIAKNSIACQNRVRPKTSVTCRTWGNWVAIQHPGGLVTLYAHLSNLSTLSVGSEISTGEILGYEGATGYVTGSHLHFSVYTEFFTYNHPETGELFFSYNYDKTLNPLDYL